MINSFYSEAVYSSVIFLYNFTSSSTPFSPELRIHVVFCHSDFSLTVPPCSFQKHVSLDCSTSLSVLVAVIKYYDHRHLKEEFILSYSFRGQGVHKGREGLAAGS